MTRQTFIVAEPFPFEGISTRKLVLETAYYNVITAYGADELIETARRFPAADSVVVHSELPGLTSDSLGRVRQVIGDKPIIYLSSTGHQTEDHADVVLSSHDPQLLLGKLRELFGSADTQNVVRMRRKA